MRVTWAVHATVVGSALALFVGSADSADRRRVNVPDVYGRRLTTAFEQLRPDGLRVGIESDFFLASNVHALVSRQRPLASARVRRAQTVTLTVDRALKGLAVGGGHPVIVPLVAGLPLDHAVRALSGVGLTFWVARAPPIRSSAARTLFAAYCVTGQSPEAGTTFQQVIPLGRNEHGAVTSLTAPVVLTLAGRRACFG
jgi:beta-lactam-binding protein with PASTA domain